jgi:hypothetical protein
LNFTHHTITIYRLDSRNEQQETRGGGLLQPIGFLSILYLSQSDSAAISQLSRPTSKLVTSITRSKRLPERPGHTTCRITIHDEQFSTKQCFPKQAHQELSITFPASSWTTFLCSTSSTVCGSDTNGRVTAPGYNQRRIRHRTSTR